MMKILWRRKLETGSAPRICRRAAVARRDGALVLALMRHIARCTECRLWQRTTMACVAGGARADACEDVVQATTVLMLADACLDRCKGYSWPQGSALP